MSRLFLSALCALLVPLAGCDTVLEVDAVAPPPRSAAPGAARCQNCGWIETRHEILPRVFEYTVRMADGSSRVFQETLPTTWRLGERLTVIDGDAAPL